MGIVKKIKETWKQALKSGKILKNNSIVTSNRSSESFVEYVGTGQLSDNNWEAFERDERYFRQSIASKKQFYNTFVCTGDYRLWHKLIKLLVSIFCDKNARYKKQDGRQWSTSLIKFVLRVLKTFPLDMPIESDSNEITVIEKKFEYLKNTIQPWFTKLNNSSYNNDAQDNTPISREKLVKL